MIKCFQCDTAAQITVVNFGPFDNGHICVGFSTGHVLILSSFDLASIYRTQVFQSLDPQISIPVSKIIYDPLNMMIVTSEEISEQLAGEDADGEELTYFPLMAGLSLIENQADYKYIQMGPQSYMTLVIQQNRHKSATRSKSRGALNRSNTHDKNSSAFGCFE